MDKSDVQSLLDRICQEIRKRIDPRQIEMAKRRQADMFAWRQSDYIPLVTTPWRPPIPDLPAFDWAEQFHDPAKSLFMQLKGVLAAVSCPGDNLCSVRADTGVVNCMSVFGAEYVVPAHTKPVVSKYVPKEQLEEFELPDDVSGLGVMPRMVEHMQHHQEALRKRGLAALVTVHHCDQQGPFDIAAQTRGHDVFLDLYEDGDFVHRLMAQCVRVYVAVSKLCKRINGEPLSGGNASGVWMDSGGVRMCGDSDILISAEQHRRYVAPYQEQAFAAFGGGWLHYCGGARNSSRTEGLHLHEVYASIPHLRGLNWTTGKDWLAEMRRLRRLGVVHVGTVAREDGESLEDYFRKALSPYDSRCGMIFQNPHLREEPDQRVFDLWHEVQDDLFG